VQQRSPIAVILLSFFTLGIYGLVWLVKTKGELVARGADIPTAWLLIVPLVNIWWLWKYSQGVEMVTGAQMTGVVAFILMVLLGFIGYGIIQDSYNKVAAPAVAAA
jgi:uncharacterized protein DUF4234